MNKASTPNVGKTNMSNAFVQAASQIIFIVSKRSGTISASGYCWFNEDDSVSAIQELHIDPYI